MSASGDDVPPPDGPLRGWLQKKGVKGPAKTWKRRWFKQEGTRIDYYVSKDDEATKMGTISLDDVISVHPTSNEKRRDGKAGFRLNTPQRIYNLMADNQELMSYWVNGLVAILKEQTRIKAGGADGTELQKRIDGLVSENNRLRKALEWACEKVGVDVDEAMSASGAVTSSLSGDAKASSGQKTSDSASASADKSAAAAVPSSKAATAATTAGAGAGAGAGAAGGDAAKANTVQPGFKSFKARVLYDFTATRNEQLSLSVGEIIEVQGEHEGGWSSGCNSSGQLGFLPSSYCQKISDDDDE